MQTLAKFQITFARVPAGSFAVVAFAVAGVDAFAVAAVVVAVVVVVVAAAAVVAAVAAAVVVAADQCAVRSMTSYSP